MVGVRADWTGGSLGLQRVSWLLGFKSVPPERRGDELPSGGELPSRRRRALADDGVTTEQSANTMPVVAEQSANTMPVTLSAREEVPACGAEGPPSGAVGLRADGLDGEDADSVEVACEARGPRESAYQEQSGSPGQGDTILIFASSSSLSLIHI